MPSRYHSAGNLYRDSPEYRLYLQESNLDGLTQRSPLTLINRDMSPLCCMPSTLIDDMYRHSPFFSLAIINTDTNSGFRCGGFEQRLETPGPGSWIRPTHLQAAANKCI